MKWRWRDDGLDDEVPRLCTCDWSTVNTVSIDPPWIEYINPDCPRHGWRDIMPYVEPWASREDDGDRAPILIAFIACALSGSFVGALITWVVMRL
jgi:hypothetical protein